MHISYPLENITSLVYSIVFFDSWFFLFFLSLSLSLIDCTQAGFVALAEKMWTSLCYCCLDALGCFSGMFSGLRQGDSRLLSGWTGPKFYIRGLQVVNEFVRCSDLLRCSEFFESLNVMEMGHGPVRFGSIMAFVWQPKRSVKSLTARSEAPHYWVLLYVAAWTEVQWVRGCFAARSCSLWNQASIAIAWSCIAM